jgi:alkanesulfonate monooxygenase SsuD/methylene tetrahydromethanopterin reductase-like flavin-dependent oxidoreductase (luciferase family)
MTVLADGSVGLALYLHDLPVAQAVDRLVAQAVLAEESGFDGVTVPEHHAGFRSYLPTPLLAASWLLCETERLWVGPVPLLLPLRNAALVAEELSWLDVRFPGRVVAGTAPGYQADDFRAVDDDGFERRGAVYGARLQQLAAALRGEAGGLLGRDHSLADRSRPPVPVVGAAGSPAAARRAASAGVGLLMDSTTSDDRLSEVAAAYVAAGGNGPRLLNRRVWVGDPPVELLERQLAAYRDKADAASWMQSVTADVVAAGTPPQIVERLLSATDASGATSVALRVHLQGLEPAEADEQIRQVGEQLLPALREALAHHAPAAPR